MSNKETDPFPPIKELSREPATDPFPPIKELSREPAFDPQGPIDGDMDGYLQALKKRGNPEIYDPIDSLSIPPRHEISQLKYTKPNPFRER